MKTTTYVAHWMPGTCTVFDARTNPGRWPFPCLRKQRKSTGLREQVWAPYLQSVTSHSDISGYLSVPPPRSRAVLRGCCTPAWHCFRRWGHLHLRPSPGSLTCLRNEMDALAGVPRLLKSYSSLQSSVLKQKKEEII